MAALAGCGGSDVPMLFIEQDALRLAPCWTNNNEAFSFRTGVNNCLFGDGSVKALRESLTIGQFARLLTHASGEINTIE